MKYDHSRRIKKIITPVTKRLVEKIAIIKEGITKRVNLLQPTPSEPDNAIA